MKKKYFLVLVLLLFASVNAQIIKFPDANFKAKLLADGIDTNGNGEVEVNEAQQVEFLTLEASSISSLEGISSFTNLRALSCNNNQLTSLNVNDLINLEQLSCDYNQLTSLDVSSLTKISYLTCGNNLLTSLNISGLINLQFLLFDYNQLVSIDLSSSTNLLDLYVGNNQLTSLNLSGLTKLRQLYCYYNQLTSIDIIGLTSLGTLSCEYNQLSSLDLSGLPNLNSLSCSNNKLSSLDITGLPNLTSFQFWNNQIKTIDFSSSSNIIELEGGQNPIEFIDFSYLPNLENLWIGYTPIHTFDLSNLKKLKGVNISNCPNLEYVSLKNGSLEDLTFFEDLSSLQLDGRNFSNCPKLQYICGDESELAAISQKISSYNYANCVVGSYCSFTPGGTFYTIQGNNSYDSNNNGCDVLDLPAANLKFSITDGTNTGSVIANATGSYSIPVQAGTQTITPVLENPNYFNVSPTSTIVTFPTQASPFTQDFCVTANGVHPDLEVSILPITRAIPGFDATYKVIYKNKGNQTQSGSINLNFNDAVLDLISANPLTTVQTTDNLSWDFANLLPFETREITVIVNVNSPLETPAVNNGDVLAYNATLISAATDETLTDNSFTFNQIAVNSFDPNDKTCMEGTIIAPSAVGKEVHYMIRFENKGTANAQNIVVKDMIDISKFDISSLVPTSGSHSFTTRITNTNQVEFIFENINLPFDDANNDGYIAFKIKTMPSLTVGDSFSNSASIYFDYNAPIVTNTATTSILQALGTQDFEFANYLSVYPNPAKNLLNIAIKKQIELTSISIYNTLGQLVLVIPNAQQVSSVDVSGLKTGNYFIKVNSDKGSANAKFIKE
ncbi:DUF7619 domain-containing protein [Flavobacterium psychrotolerans]|uniref:T9SS C-terminal target domain-containing protein n=1 Tax=Flavobacterium psychrotolerans TaxID=2169410 RepID=A0A2U1JPV3_9FLAO|nr:leucine-rich repeat domain-containing protein [Flavobacterium psychrotolerans]PWA07206.1 T9SS C-terminal target domain-containing protein [Flavobacterium psychrotolerans]